MRVLLLTYETPSYPGGGGASRVHALIEPIASRHRIRVISTGGPPALGKTPDNVDIRYVDPGPMLGPPDEGWLRKNVMHYLRAEPWLYRLAGHHVAAIASIIDEELRSFDPDVIAIVHEELVPLLSRLPQEARTAFEYQNFLLEVQRQNLRGKNSWETAKNVLELGVLARAERRALRRATVSVVVSDPMVQTARRLNRSARVALIPNTVDLGYFTPHGSADPKPTAVMTASFHYPPNQEATEELLSAVWPAVLARVPEAELRLVGQNMPVELRESAQAAAGVVVVGRVEDVRPELGRAWVALAPLRKGSGSQLKVIEAFAMGVPVVGAPRVAEALRLGPDDGLLVGRSAADMAARIVELLSDPAKRDRLGATARRVVEERFDGARVAEDLERVWLSAARPERTRG